MWGYGFYIPSELCTTRMSCLCWFIYICYGTDEPKNTEHLLSLEWAKERLHLFEANLLEEGSFDPIADGCECVFHTACPVFYSVTDPWVGN